MARSNLPRNVSFESSVIIHRLRSYRPFDEQHSEQSKRRRRSARPFVVARLLTPDPGPDVDTQSGPGCLAGR